MPPPRQRAADDSRSEASSGTAGGHSSSKPKSRKTGPAAVSVSASVFGSGSAAGPSSTVKDLKVAAATGAAAAAAAATAAGQQQQSSDDPLPSIAWSEMPLSLLHDYRHAHKLASPSAYARPISRLLLSSGIGLRSPTAIAARRAALASSSASSTSSSSNNNSSSSSNNKRNPTDDPTSFSKSRKNILHKQPISQNRVSKEQLALAVRKHFNAAGLVEQEAIARFLYKVREEGKGREFRLRFQP